MGMKFWSFQDNGNAGANGGLYGAFEFNAQGLMFLGFTTPNAGTGPSLKNAQIRVHPGFKPAVGTSDGGGGFPSLFAEGIPLTSGQWFRLKGIESNWYFSVQPQGVGDITYWFMVLEDECFEAGTLNLLTPPSSIFEPSASGTATAVAQLVTATPAILRGWYLFNSDVAPAYLQFFDTNDPTTVTLGTTVPVMSLGVPAGAAANIAVPDGVRFFKNGIVVAATTTRNGNVAPGAPMDFNLFF